MLRRVTPPVGADVESLCAKCGDVWHVVVAKVGDRIARVQCKQCGAPHRLKPPGGPVAKEPKEKAEREDRMPGPKIVKIVSFSKSGNHRATVKKVKVFGNQRVTAGGLLKRKDAKRVSPKKKASD